ncbi:MAG: DNA mismatch repair endonuclease MutL [Eubacterium sp.]|nr:DNA mismatch repair endonuclease MutL [Eubacterium sp.]
MINILDQSTINKIAAGEVIERPMSIVKELVENSVDAEASQITVEIKDGGLSYIRVTDNGNGIEKDDVRKAYMRHATSKLKTAEELMGIMTLGFRGEALSTIAAVTETEMVTKRRDSLTGIKYVINGGQEKVLEEVGAPDGTTVISRNIFFNTPARLKFLKTATTEGSYINDLMIRVALSHPYISIKLINNGKMIINTSGNGKLRDTVYAVYGRDITSNLLPVDYNEDGIGISGFIGKPFISKGNRSFETYFINGRYITNAVITKAIEEAFRTYIMQHKFPFTVLYLDLDPKMCDVNIHPTKKEFKYYNEKALFHAVYHAVADALSNREIISPMKLTEEKEERKSDNINSSIGIKNQINNSSNNINVINSQNSNIVDGINITDYQDKNSGNKFNSTGSNNDGNNTGSNNTGNNNFGINNTDNCNINSYRADMVNRTENKNSNEKTNRTDSNNDFDKTNSIHSNINNGTKSGASHKDVKFGINKSSYKILEKLLPKEYLAEVNEKKPYGETAREEVQNEPQDAYKETYKEIHEESSKEKEMIGTQKNLFEDDYISKEAISHHRIIGLAFDTYWISQYKDALYLMDQHAAHEKVNYERFLRAFKERSIVSQRIFPPEIISLSSLEMNAVMDNLEYFRNCGFEIDEFGGNEVKISSMPINYIDFSGRDVFLQFVSYLVQNISGITEDLFVTRLATMGCKAAVKGNQRISVNEAQKLIEDLLTLDNPYTCPHGRPTIIKLTKEELEKKFKRIV